jgi:hypothetical protein
MERGRHQQGAERAEPEPHVRVRRHGPEADDGVGDDDGMKRQAAREERGGDDGGVDRLAHGVEARRREPVDLSARVVHGMERP